MLRLLSTRLTTNLQCCRPISKAALKRTALYDLHVTNSGKMVPFAGYEMPVQYGRTSILDSHRHVRSHCGLFDVSHMLQTSVSGGNAVEFLERISVCNAKQLKENRCSLSVFTNSRGGIEDDLIVSNCGSHFYLVSNAACAQKDLAMMQATAGEMRSSGLDVNVTVLDRSLLALQGPRAVDVLMNGCSVALNQLPFMNTVETTLFGVEGCRVTRCGYTGEDGFELSVPNEAAVQLVDTLLAVKLSPSDAAPVQLVGLGARDTLRLEAGLCLYGNDIDDSTTPVEAGLSWLIGKRRRKTAGFPGAEVILSQLKEGASRRLIGAVQSTTETNDRLPPVRAGAELFGSTESEQPIGKVTSGTPSPTLAINIAMAYLPTELATSASSIDQTDLKKIDVFAKVRDKFVPMTVVKLPFIKTNYFR